MGEKVTIKHPVLDWIFFVGACLFALLEFAILLIACFGQLASGFSSQEAFGAIFVAFIGAVVSSFCSILGFFTCDPKTCWPSRLLTIIWIGFTVSIFFGLAINEIFVSGRRP